MDWIDVKERLPETIGEYVRRSETVLMFDSKMEMVRRGFYTRSNNKSLIQSGWRAEGVAGIWIKSITHWAIPTPPEVEDHR